MLMIRVCERICMFILEEFFFQNGGCGRTQKSRTCILYFWMSRFRSAWKLLILGIDSGIKEVPVPKISNLGSNHYMLFCSWDMKEYASPVQIGIFIWSPRFPAKWWSNQVDIVVCLEDVIVTFRNHSNPKSFQPFVWKIFLKNKNCGMMIIILNLKSN